jgi:uncharacterized protein involved in cysteine biosynthesis
MVTAGLFSPIIDTLANMAKFIGHWVLWALISMVNALVAAVGFFINAVVSLLPTMPSGNSGVAGSWLGWLNYYMPIAELVTGLLVWIAVWTLFLVIRIPLRWAKAV